MAPDIGLANWFRQRAARTPERSALHFEGERWTYEQMQQEIERCAARLQALGVARGDRVAFLGLNQPMFFFSMFATLRLGAIFVPLNFRLTGPEIAFMLNDCTAKVLIVDAQLRPIIAAVRDELKTVTALLAAEEPEAWVGGDLPVTAHAAVGEDDVAMIMYTSGTTGRPKGAMLTHGNFWWNNTNTMHALDVVQDDVTLVAAPVFHIGGLNVTTLVTLQKGGLVVLQRAFDPGKALADIVAHRVTTMFGVPAMFQFMAQHPTFEASDLSTVRVLVVGGAPCPEPVLKAYLARNVKMQQGYGLTETAPMVSFLAPEFALAKVGSSGKPATFRGGEAGRRQGAPGHRARREGRSAGARPQYHERLLESARSDARGNRRGGLVPHRRRRLSRRGRLCLHLRPRQGHDHQRRRERLSGRDRERPDAPPRHRRGCRHRRAGREMGRARGGDRRAQSRS